MEGARGLSRVLGRPVADRYLNFRIGKSDKYTLCDKKSSSDIREQLGIFKILITN